MLEQRGENGSWHVVCHGKCEDDFLLHTQYRTRGDGTRSSSPFRFAGEAGDRVIVRPHTHSRAGFALGVTMVSAGGLALVVTGVGVILLVAHPHSKVVQKISNAARAVLPQRVASLSPEEPADARPTVAWRPLAPSSALFTIRF